MQHDQAQQGGKVYGQGWYGRTMDAGHIEGDSNTMHAELVEAGAHTGKLRLKVWSSPDKSKELGPLEVRALCAAVERAHDMVSKRFVLKDKTRDVREAFMAELLSANEVRRAFGKAVEQHTTLHELRVSSTLRVLGLEVVDKVSGACSFYMFSKRCELPLDRFVFDESNVRIFVGHILDSLAVLHNAGIYHADVKFDNMIYCAAERRFKLIDWGNTVDKDRMALRLVGPKSGATSFIGRPLNSACPFAFQAAGLGPWTPAILAGYAAYRFPLAIATSAAFFELLKEAHAAFVAEESRFRAALRPEVMSNRDQLRRAIINKYAPSFDLYSFALMAAHLACAPQEVKHLSHSTRELLMTLARKLTLYGAQGDCTSDAQAAATWWHRASGKVAK